MKPNLFWLVQNLTEIPIVQPGMYNRLSVSGKIPEKKKMSEALQIQSVVQIEGKHE
ncbi:hypothetical protein ACEPP6_10555 [Bacillus rugosus]|uniref:hypothetical protein n=1 Tax=Bacillus rugosus TaxID=2715209 RepID=UPI0035A303E8